MNKSISLIAELAQAHDGSLGIAHSYIDALAGTGVDAIKFQTHIAEAESSSFEPFRTKFSFEDKTRYDYWKRMEFTHDQWQGLKNHCEDVGLEFISSPFSLKAVDLLEKIGVKRYKIGSGEVLNLLLLDKIAQTDKPIILSSGMSSFQELDNAINFLKPSRNHLSILQCTTAYPTQPHQWGLNVLAELHQKYKLPVGFSDHSGNIIACLAAASLGASILEFHVVFDKRMFGPDAASSLTIDQVKQLVDGVRDIEIALNNPITKNASSEYNDLKVIFGKSISINKAMKRGDSITIECLESTKPGNMGIPAAQYKTVIGKILNKDLGAYSFLTYDDLI